MCSSVSIKTEAMFDILLYLYDNYLAADLAPDAAVLSSKLSAVGFDADDIDRALDWLAAMDVLDNIEELPSHDGTRCYTALEQQHLAVEGISFLCFLESADFLPAHAREWVIDRAMALEGPEVSADKIKWIALLAINRLHGAGNALWLEDLIRGEDDTPPTLH
ncbi:MAG: DUF494 domain-containing protein [Betaproteobacteria bacterium]|nr:MAG: DUF494 domain-containing protein [Betaproteobacteria bacterium]